MLRPKNIRTQRRVADPSPIRRLVWLLLPYLVWAPYVTAEVVASAERAAEYERRGSKSIEALQQFRTRTQTQSVNGAGREGVAALINLNPRINAWFVLRLRWNGDAHATDYHLENPFPASQQLHLVDGFPRGVLLSGRDKETRCELWSDDSLAKAHRSGLPFYPLCDGSIYLRNPSQGRRSKLETLAEFLRDKVSGGEQIVGFVKRGFFQDSFMEMGTPIDKRGCLESAAGAPVPAKVREPDRGSAVAPQNLGIELDNGEKSVVLGCWYRVTGMPDIYLSTYEPRAAPAAVFDTHGGRLASLDSVEARALDYLVAFDLGKFELHFELGTDHPRLGWSRRAVPAVRDDTLAGPDGFDTSSPLVTTGMVLPELARSTVASFTGGFKRQHGAFRYGDLAHQNAGSHYGFISHGVVFSKLQPGLSTLLVLDDGSVRIKTWASEDDKLLGQIRHARQNGVALVQRDEQTGKAVPGELVARWGPGNWSGSAEGKLRSLRAGACIQDNGEHRFLIYGYFSTATPSAMARVFAAYGCTEAMHLDMNALEHTYLAVYTRRGEHITVQHLITGMEVLDKERNGELVPRFMGLPDNRDFFYLTRRAATE